MQEEQVKAEARKAAREASFGAPFRFFCMPGESREVVIVDEMPDFFRHEHAMLTKGTKRWDTYVPCVAEHANCPACDVAERPSYFAMYLTIIDLTPYEDKNGDTVEFSKKLLVVKPTQQKKIMRLYDRHKTLRGMVLNMARDTKEDAQIGNDIEFVEFMDEEDLLTYETEYVDQKNVAHPVICHEPYNYEEFMPDMTDKQLRAIIGGRPDAGSRESNARELANDSWNEPTRAPRTASRRGAPAPDDDQDDDAPSPAPRRAARGAAPAEEPAPARTTRRTAAEPAEAAPSRSTRRAAPAPEPEGDDLDPDTGLPWDEEGEGQEAEPAPRAAAPSQRRAAAPRGRAAPAQQEEEPEEDQPAPARGAGVAGRRASLRR